MAIKTFALGRPDSFFYSVAHGGFSDWRNIAGTLDAVFLDQDDDGFLREVTVELYGGNLISIETSRTLAETPTLAGPHFSADFLVNGKVTFRNGNTDLVVTGPDLATDETSGEPYRITGDADEMRAFLFAVAINRNATVLIVDDGLNLLPDPISLSMSLGRPEYTRRILSSTREIATQLSLSRPAGVLESVAAIGIESRLSFSIANITRIGRGTALGLDLSLGRPERNLDREPTFLETVDAEYVAIVGTPFSLTLPAADAKPDPQYRASGVGSGLEFARTARLISGIPTEPGELTVVYEAFNAEGSSALRFRIRIDGPPPKPVDLVAVLDDNGIYRLTAVALFGEVTDWQYRIRVGVGEYGAWIDTDDDGLVFTHPVPELRGGFQYKVQVRAGNDLGFSTPSDELALTTPAHRLTASTDLLIDQYQLPLAPQLNTMLGIFVSAAESQIEAMNEMERMRRVDEAIGVWLDRIGERIGLARPSVIDQGTAFGFDDSGVGFDQGRMRDDAIIQPRSPAGDALYRRLIKARAWAILGYGNAEYMRRAVREIDPTAILIDLDDMSFRVSTARGADILLADQVGALARPAGVRMRVVDSGQFGFDDAGVGLRSRPDEHSVKC